MFITFFFVIDKKYVNIILEEIITVIGFCIRGISRHVCVNSALIFAGDYKYDLTRHT